MTQGTDVRDSEAIRRVPLVGRMMRTRFLKVGPEKPLAELAQLLVKRKSPCAAVVEGDGRFVGFVSVRGVLSALAGFLHDERPTGAVSRSLEAEAPTLREDTTLLEAIEAFAAPGRGPCEMLAVLREDRIVGVLTRLDTVRATLDYLASAGGLASAQNQEPATLYISALKESGEKPDY